MTANAYTFLPWLRSGIATRITTDPVGTSRATVPVKLRVTGEAVDGGTQVTRDVERTVQIYGPGDVIGVAPRAISRTEPRPWVTNVEPNYLAHIEFYDEDFPWRYSPAAPDATTRRLRPWLALIVLAGGEDSRTGDQAEFKDGTAAGRPLPFITVTEPDALPPPGQLGAWAHVHVDGSLDAPVSSDDMTKVLPGLRQVLHDNADRACARLVCPRRLDPHKGYHAFLVPAFETGRLAGLGLDPARSPAALHPAWKEGYPGQEALGQLPYYHRWFFSTGSAGDFEHLVRLLVPREPLDPSVGRRDLDVHRSPGPGLPGITVPAELGGVLKLGGALRIPERVPDIWDKWDNLQDLGLTYPHPFQQALAGLINLADDYLTKTPATAHITLAATNPAAPAGHVDPVITPPLYGRWHAPASRLLTGRDGNPLPHHRNWVHRLNLDPRYRIAANLGAQVVQKRQEEFMAAAWAQVGDVLAANAKIRAAQLAREVGAVLQTKHLDPPPAPAREPAPPSGKVLTITAPAHARVVTRFPASQAPSTAESESAAATSAGPAERVAVGFRVAESRVTAAPLSSAMRRITRPGSRLMRRLPFTEERPPQALVPRMDAESGGVTAAAPKARPASVVTPAQLDQVLHGPGPAVEAAVDPVDLLPTSQNFTLTLPGDSFVPSPGGPDSPEAAAFKGALRDVYQGWDDAALAGRTGPRRRLHVTDATDAMLAGLRADATVPRHLLSSVNMPERLAPFAEQFLEAMAYPVLDMPMYQALIDQSVDLFMPNINRVPPNSVTLLESDQEFIESYLVGLNHEMARELLWREYPTDQRGTPFRQFWDVRAVPSLPGETPEERRERLYDIPPVATWTRESKLGRHDNRDKGEQENELVLVIRGELLKKYPNAAVYAHRARWEPSNAQPDPTKERVPIELVDEANPSHDEIRLPLYEAKVEPDIYLLGFDLTSDEARGEVPTGSAGWFFVIKERPGEPRFGLDVAPATTPQRVEVWNDLSWPDVAPDGKRFIELGENTVPVVLQEFDQPTEDAEKQDQHVEDLSLPIWHGGLSSADIAYILFQAPVLMAVHAQEMLP
ncbi:hypothetical protein [Streptomyces lateritius]|uniref:hypothetical protein n=1 Tax=Streptomyces lateritius TaxID=67313 RepID=UPI001672963F|nr:hypothetical protein [Streptomyces lateritius]GGU12242.1 hypothetical protein GCM10010272_66840 [Streptomyces lateritius]